MEESDLNPTAAGGSDQEPQVLYMSDGTFYTAAAGDGQEGMVTYMYGDDQSGETQYMMIQGEEGDGALQAAGEPYMVTTPDGSIQYVLVSSDMVSSAAQPQFVLDQSMMTIVSGGLDVGGLPTAEPAQLSEMAPMVTSEVDFLNTIDPVVVNPVEAAPGADITDEKTLVSDVGGKEGPPLESVAGVDTEMLYEPAVAADKSSEEAAELKAEFDSGSAPEAAATELDSVLPGTASVDGGSGTLETKAISSATVAATVVSPVAISSVMIPSVAEGDKTKKGVESLARTIRVTSVPLPSSRDPLKDPKPIITVKPSAVKTLDGDRIKIETMGGVQKVFILPMNSPEKSTPKPAVKPPLPLRIITQEKTSLPAQTISLPTTTTTKTVASSAKTAKPAAAAAPTKSSSVLTPNIIKRPVGRPPVKDKAKTPQQPKSGAVKIRPSSSQVIVIPIQITKDSTAQLNGADTKLTPSSAGAPKPKATPGVKKEPKDKELVAGVKATPKVSKKLVQKSDDDSSLTRRSKRSSNMSMKLAEWGLLPTGNRSSSEDEDDDDDDELDGEMDFDDEEDGLNDFYDDDNDDNESNSSITLGIYAKSAQKGARKLVSTDEKPFVTPVSTKATYGKVPIRFPAASSAAKIPLEPKEMQNKSLMCKPIMMTKATSCNPIRMTKVTQTEEDEGDVTKIVVPVPVPLFVPAPVASFGKPAPVPVPIPVPVPFPSFLPMTKSSISSILKKLQELRESLPAEDGDKDTEAAVEGGQEVGNTGGDNPKALDKEKDEVLSQPVEEASHAAAASASGPQIPLEVVEMAMQIASQLPDADADEESGAASDSNATAAVESIELGTSSMEVDGELTIKQEALAADASGPPAKKARSAEPEPCTKSFSVLRQVPINDMHMKLKYSYGVSAWGQWVAQKNAQLEADAAGATKGRIKLFKTEILQCNAEELNFGLCLFIREVRKPTGEEYAPDSVYYLCLGIQHYLYENCRIDSLFTDACYRKFSDALNEMLSGFEVRLSAHGQIVCRITEEHLWESRQLGAHSPYNLLNTLVYFNTKHFMLNNVEGHLGLSFSNIMKQWKKNAPTTDGRPARTVFLRYNAVGPVITSTVNGDANQRRKSSEMLPYEQLENPENPMRCPVKLYEFYLSKCPESIKHRNDLFYLSPEPSCVPDSPVWYSSSALGGDVLTKMLNRIRIVREVQESQINQLPAYYT